MGLTLANTGRTIAAAEVEHGEQLTYLLTITFAGRAFRWSFPSGVNLTTSTGESISFHGMDAPEAVQALDFETDSPADLSVSFDGLVFPGDVDIPLLIAQGHRLERAVGELAAIVDDGAHGWDDRYVLLQGLVSEPVYGDPTLHRNAVGFTLEAPGYDDTALFPSVSQVIASADFPDEVQGLVRPFVFGTPGVYRYPGLTGWDVGLTYVHKGTPAIPYSVGITNRSWLVAGHLVAPASYSQDLTLWDATDELSYTVTISQTLGIATPTLTGNDNSFTSASVSSLDLAAWDPTHEYWIRAWTDTTTGDIARGGYPNNDWTGPMVSAGEVLEYMLGRSSLMVDKGRCAIATALLTGFKIGGYIAEQVTPYEWIIDNLIPMLPVTLASGPKGIYPIVWRYNAIARDAVEVLTEGANFRRLSGVVTNDTAICNEFTVNYVSDGGTLLRSLTLSGKLDSTDDGGGDVVFGSQSTLFYRPNMFARRSYLDHDQTLYSDSLDCHHVWDDSVAALIAAWKIRAHAFATKTITYGAGFAHAWLEPGDVVLLTDPDLYLDRQVCLIQTKTWDVTGLQFDMLLIQDPPRDRRPAVAAEPEAPPDTFLSAVLANMAVSGIWVFPEDEIAGPIASGANVLVDVAGTAPAFRAQLSATGNWTNDTSDTPIGSGVLSRGCIDCGTGHLDGEYAALATALSATSYCGGIILRVPTVLTSPSEQTVFTPQGTHSTPYDIGNGQATDSLMVSYYPGPGHIYYDATHFSYANYTGWVHIQWRRTGTDGLHWYVSRIGAAFKAAGEDSQASGMTYTTGGQIGHGGTVGGGVNLKVACVYLGTDAALPEAALQAIHEDGGLA